MWWYFLPRISGSFRIAKEKKDSWSLSFSFSIN
jgi:hypothetical protein